MGEAFGNILSGVEFNVIMKLSILGIMAALVHGWFKYGKVSTGKYVIDTWILSGVSFYVITYGLYIFNQNIVEGINYSNFNKLNENTFYYLIKIFISSGLATVLVLFVLGYVSKSIHRCISKLLNLDTLELDSEMKNTIFVRVIILNIFIFLAMGQIEYSLLIFAILLGKFIWIGTSKKDIINEIRYMSGDHEKKGDLESYILFVFLGYFIMLGSILYKIYILFIRG